MIFLLGTGSFFLWQYLLSGEVQAPPGITSPVVASPLQAPVGPWEGPLASTPGDVPPSEAPSLAPQAMVSSTLYIPALGAYGPVDETSGRVQAGTLSLPGPTAVTRWQGGAAVASPRGTILVAGHVNVGSTRGVLYSLGRLRPGQVAHLKDAQGRLASFQLERLEAFKKASLPQGVWNPRGPKRLVVVTCGGDLSQGPDGRWHFDSNLVATFKPLATP